MKRARIIEASQPFKIEVVDIPNPPPDGLIVKTAYSGICHSDLHNWQGMLDLGDGAVLRFSEIPDYKRIPGHEIAGSVYSLGSNLTSDDSIKIGDSVVVYPWLGCQNCSCCKSGHANLCDTRCCISINVAGGYSTHVMIPHRRNVVKVPEGIPLHIACMMPCAVITAYSAVSKIKEEITRVANLEGRASLLIVGAGGLGLWCLQICKYVLPIGTKIVVADISEKKLEVARKHGGDDTILWPRDINDGELIKLSVEKSVKLGFNAVIDFVNNKTTAERAYKCLRKNGVQVAVGIFGGIASFCLPDLILGAKQIRGSFVGSQNDLKDMFDLFTREKLLPPPIRYVKLEDATDVMYLMMQGKLEGRVIIKFA